MPVCGCRCVVMGMGNLGMLLFPKPAPSFRYSPPLCCYAALILHNSATRPFCLPSVGWVLISTGRKAKAYPCRALSRWD